MAKKPPKESPRHKLPKQPPYPKKRKRKKGVN
jgi:hypothetical protein